MHKVVRRAYKAREIAAKLVALAAQVAAEVDRQSQRAILKAIEVHSARVRKAHNKHQAELEAWRQIHADGERFRRSK